MRSSGRRSLRRRCGGLIFAPLVRKGDKTGRQFADDPIDRPIGRRLFSGIFRDLPDLAVQSCNRKRWRPQGEPFDGYADCLRDEATALLCPLASVERVPPQTESSILCNPALRRSKGSFRLRRY